MTLRDIITFYIVFPLGILWILKAFILKIKLSKKEKILVKYAPPKLFLVANINLACSFVGAIYSKSYLLNQEFVMNYLMVSLFLWFGVATWGRRRYFKSINNRKGSRNDILLFILLIITIGMMKFT